MRPPPRNTSAKPSSVAVAVEFGPLLPSGCFLQHGFWPWLTCKECSKQNHLLVWMIGSHALVMGAYQCKQARLAAQTSKVGSSPVGIQFLQCSPQDSQVRSFQIAWSLQPASRVVRSKLRYPRASEISLVPTVLAPLRSARVRDTRKMRSELRAESRRCVMIASQRFMHA